MNAWDISFSSLSVGYGDHAVLHDINATLPGGTAPQRSTGQRAAGPA